jgi:Kef-type K+ transport system membrane component KefB
MGTVTFLNAHPVLTVFAVAVIAALLAELPIGISVPVGVLQLVLGIVIGPHVLGLVDVDAFLALMAHYGTCALFFMAGMELDLDRVRGRPLSLALQGWLVSLLLGITAAGLLHVIPLVHAPVFIAVALTTTALGLLVPVLRDGGDLETPFGRHVLAAAAAGELGPVMVMSLVFAHGYNQWQEAGLMLGFVVLAASCALVALGARPPRLVAFLARGLHKSAQLPVLLSMLLLVGFVVLAEEIGLETALGAFAAGMVFGLATRDQGGQLIRTKIEAVMFGFLIPFFYVVNGMRFDLTGLLASTTAMLLMPLFLCLLVVVRGIPAWLYRADLGPGEWVPFVLYTSVALPILLAVTHIGVQSGRMSSDLAAALVGAGIISVLLFPALALRLRARTVRPGAETTKARP